MTLAHIFHKNPLHPIALDMILINTIQKFTQKQFANEWSYHFKVLPNGVLVN
jgi:hypothetical protein